MSFEPTPFRPARGRCRGLSFVLAAMLAACGGEASNHSAGGDPASSAPQTTLRDAVRLANQATFGPTPRSLEEIRARGVAAWIRDQMALGTSRYTSGGDDSLHRHAGPGKLCDGAAACLRDNASTAPLLADFYRNAVEQPDQLRQRMALALQHILVVSGLEVEGTYGLRIYYNQLLGHAFGNYRELLAKVALSPVMGDYLSHVNNDKAAPNENFARELLQLFSVGRCVLNRDGTPKGGRCEATYDNETVRAYAHALTGWTYPPGGAARPGCAAAGLNCRYHGGDMVPAPREFRDASERRLLSGATVPAGSDAVVALERVLDSLMAHPSMAPFIARQLILHLVMSNPSPAYVARVASAFDSGRHGGFGTGARGDLAATVAAILLDPEARQEDPGPTGGKLREPALLFTGALRALNGRTDGDSLGTPWGDAMRQPMFRPTSVFNYFKPDYPVPGTDLVGPEFAIHGEGAAIARLNFLDWLVFQGGTATGPEHPQVSGTHVDLSGFTAQADDAAGLVDRLSLLVNGRPLPLGARESVIAAVAAWAPETDRAQWKENRARTAAYLVLASPDFQVQP